MRRSDVTAAYGARAAEYTAAVGRIEHVAAADLALIEPWAIGVSGAVLDVGCGPGQWTRHLHDLGADITGVDPTPEFISQARADHPNCTFRLGSAQHLDVADGSIGGILAWYSLIHVEPADLAHVCASLSRALTPGGGLAVGFFTGPTVGTFAHAITTAYRWPMSALADLLADAGFSVTHTEEREDPGVRPHGAVLAIRD